MAEPFEYNLPVWLRELRNGDSVLEFYIEESETREIPYVQMLEGLIRIIANRSDFFIQHLFKYKQKFGDLPEESEPINQSPN